MTDYTPSDEAVHAALNVIAPGGSPHKNLERALAAALPIERARWEREELDPLTVECAKLGMAGGMMQAERDEARAEVDRLKALLASAEDEAREAAEAAAELRADVERLGRP